MSTTDKTPIDENEWQAQERGMRAALRHDADGLDVAAANYRVIAKALMSTPRSEPPDDFAADVVKRIAHHDARFERLLSRILLTVFIVSSLIVGVLYGEQWWQPLHQALGDAAPGWVLTAMGCVILSWTGSRLLEFANPTGEPRRAA